MFVTFFHELKAAGVPVTLREYLTLMEAMEQDLAGRRVVVATHDDRVVPWHSFKFGAALQAAQDCKNPILVRVETRAGHGSGKPVWMQIEDFADQWAFLTRNLQMPLPQVAGDVRSSHGDGSRHAPSP